MVSEQKSWDSDKVSDCEAPARAIDLPAVKPSGLPPLPISFASLLVSLFKKVLMKILRHIQNVIKNLKTHIPRPCLKSKT